jgi:hypothetical protein
LKYAIERLQIIETLRVHYSWFSRCEGVHNHRMVGGAAGIQEATPLTKAQAASTSMRRRRGLSEHLERGTVGASILLVT